MNFWHSLLITDHSCDNFEITIFLCCTGSQFMTLSHLEKRIFLITQSGYPIGRTISSLSYKYTGFSVCLNTICNYVQVWGRNSPSCGCLCCTCNLKKLFTSSPLSCIRCNILMADSFLSPYRLATSVKIYFCTVRRKTFKEWNMAKLQA